MRIFVYGEYNHFVYTPYCDLPPLEYDLVDSFLYNDISFFSKNNYTLLLTSNNTNVYEFNPVEFTTYFTGEEFEQYCNQMEEVFEDELEEDEDFLLECFLEDINCDNTLELYINNNPVLASTGSKFGVAIEKETYNLLRQRSKQPATTFIVDLYDPLTHSIVVPYAYQDKNGNYCYYDHLGYELVNLEDIHKDVVMAEMINECPVLVDDDNILGLPISDEIYHELTGKFINHEIVKKMIKSKKKN